MKNRISTYFISSLVLIVVTFLGCCSDSVGGADVIRVNAAETTETEAAITQVVRIAKAGEKATIETISLSTTGWEDFLEEYSGDGNVCISNLEIDRIFTFKELDPEYPEEVVEFLEKDKEPLTMLNSTFFPENNSLFLGEGFHVSYNQSQSWQLDEIITVALETEDDFVKFEINGAVNGKKLYCGHPRAKNGLEFLIFSKDGNLYAINKEMKLFQLVPR